MARWILAMELFDRTNAPTGGDAWFVYALVDSREPEKYRYIGITNAPRRRLGHHCSPSLDGHTHKARWVASVLRDGHDVLMRQLHSGLLQDEAKALEISLIAANREGLTNLTSGGDGTTGWVPSLETREKIAASRRGRPLRSETREKLRLANLGRTSPNKGKVLSADWRANISAAGVVRMSDPSIRLAISARGVERYSVQSERDETARKAHQSGPQRNNKSGYKGVSFRARTKSWVAQIKVSKQSFIGSFTTPEAAARAYDQAAFAAWGKDCYLNFPAEIAA